MFIRLSFNTKKCKINDWVHNGSYYPIWSSTREMVPKHLVHLTRCIVVVFRINFEAAKIRNEEVLVKKSFEVLSLLCRELKWDHESTGHRHLKLILWLAHQYKTSGTRLWNTSQHVQNPVHKYKAWIILKGQVYTFQYRFPPHCKASQCFVSVK